MRRELHFDAVVIGAGTAGLTAGDPAGAGRRARLRARQGRRLHAPRAGRRSTCSATRPSLVSEPLAALEKLAAQPDHPYALLGLDAVRRGAARGSTSCVDAGPLPGYSYVGGLERNVLLPTAVGALRPSALVPETMAAGELERARARLHRRHPRAA